jgi:hypothetical protein
MQDHPQSITAKERKIQNTILEKIRRKEGRNAKQSKQTDHVSGGNITHPRQNKGHTDIPPPPNTAEEGDNTSSSTHPTGQIKRPIPIDKVTEGTSTTWSVHQPPYRGANGRPLTSRRKQVTTN